MAKPSNDIGDRDYGRRTYASNKKYEEQRLLATDAHIDRVARRKHSEYKKPYLPDESYPEMEMFNIPWTPPKWPRKPPPDDPVTIDPVDPGGPVPKRPPPEKPHPFLGCLFYKRNLPALTPGAYYIITVYAALPGSGNDTLVSVTVEGQATVTWGGPSSLVIVLWINKNINMNPIKFEPGMSSNDPLFVQITATTASGAKCHIAGWITPCPALEVLEWNEGFTPQTIARNSSVEVAVQGGIGPFQWTVSGTGFSLAKSKTSSRSNTLIASNTACGSASISVIDGCEEETSGSVRCTTGNWTTTGVDQNSCPIPGAPDHGPYGADSSCASGMFDRILGKYKMQHCYAYAPPGAYNTTGCQDLSCDCYYSGGYPCHSVLGCSQCLTLTYWQYSGGWADQGIPCGAVGSGPQYMCYCLGATYFKVEEWKC